MTAPARPPTHDRPVSTATIVKDVGQVLSEVLCCQGYFLIILDDHDGVMPAIENLIARPPGERQRAADVLRMWAARIESGNTPKARKA